ncbi:MAG: hypothetical protein WCI95_00270 [bacterium]
MQMQNQPRIEKKTLICGQAELVASKLFLPARTEHVITACGHDGVALEQLLHDEMMAEEAQPVSRLIFGGGRYYEALGEAYLREDGCLLRLKEATCSDGQMCAMQATAISGTSLFPLRQKGRNIGVIYEDECARYCRLTGVIPLVMTASREEQTLAVFEMLDWILTTNGFCFTDTIRTWFYLDHLLDWYKEFNDVRTRFFEVRGVFNKLVPASTGIGAANPWGAALTCDLLAIQPRTADVSIEVASSPLQDSALRYASSFSRAVEVRMPSHRSLLISGTASIDAEGKTQFAGDHTRQIERTLEVVTALLESRNMAWKDVNRGIAYFKDMEDRSIFDAICRTYGIQLFPLALSQADVCRHDLLFELEVDAVKI